MLDGWHLISSRTPFRPTISVNAISQETLSGPSPNAKGRWTDEQVTPSRPLFAVERPHVFDNFKAKSSGATGDDKGSRNTQLYGTTSRVHEGEQAMVVLILVIPKDLTFSQA